MSKHFEGFKQGKVLRFVFISVQSTTPCEVGVDGGTMDQIVDLVDVKLDGYYEPFGHKLFRFTQM
ncbi:hypothetical protein AALP_AA1G112500 [Arabis alpina]|uniref:Uncharacterized protein n=1 Tax=Arabis alpina TaxID=50452 RepID=A0A087HMJ0_ARAAL|nr:hypothetical protein AALP_AA1G112500 [Arabis alpina]